jgi:hypothetical protein
LSYEGAADLPAGRQVQCSTAPARAANANGAFYVEPYSIFGRVGAMIRGSKGPFPYHEGYHLIVALRQFVYADESGTQAGARYCVVAGHRGSPVQWKRFRNDWRGILAKYGVEEFHSKVFFSRKKIRSLKRNPYIDWPDSKSSAFLGALLMAIRRRKIRPVGCAVDVGVFESYSYGERYVLAGYRDAQVRRKLRERPAPYHLAFRFMIADAIFATGPRTEIRIVLAEHEEYQQQAHEAYMLTKRLDQTGRAARQLKGFGVEPAADQPRLQAADLFAHQWYNTLVRGRARLNKENVHIMNQLTRNRKDMLVCDGPAIERIFNEAGVTVGERAQLRAIPEPPL